MDRNRTYNGARIAGEYIMAGEKIVEIMRQMSDIKDRTDTTELLFGIVTNVNPLTIKVDNRFEISGSSIILTSSVRDSTIEMTVNHTTGSTSGGSGEAAFAAHTHSYTGKKTFTVHLALKAKEKVLLLRVDNGQRFIVLDRA